MGDVKFPNFCVWLVRTSALYICHWGGITPEHQRATNTNIWSGWNEVVKNNYLYDLITLLYITTISQNWYKVIFLPISGWIRQSVATLLSALHFESWLWNWNWHAGGRLLLSERGTMTQLTFTTKLSILTQEKCTSKVLCQAWFFNVKLSFNEVAPETKG